MPDTKVWQFSNLFGLVGNIEDAVEDAKKLATHPKDEDYTLSDDTEGKSALHHSETAGDFVDDTDGILDGTIPFTGTLRAPDLLITNDIVLGGVVDGRNLAIDGAKLDAIETLATRDQSGAEIVALIVANPDTHLVNDVEKAKIEVIQEVVTATEKVKLSQTELYSVAEKAKLAGIEDGATGDKTGAEVKALYEAESDTNAFTDAEKTKLTNLQAGATDDLTGAEIKLAYEDEDDTNAFTDAEKTKLASVETSAAADQTAGELKVSYESNVDTNAYSDAEKTKLGTVETGATADQNSAQIRAHVEAATNSNAFTDAEKAKLVNIESGATADQTNAEIRIAVDAASNSNVFTDALKTKLNNLPVSPIGALEDDPNPTLAANLIGDGNQITGIAGIIQSGIYSHTGGSPGTFEVLGNTDVNISPTAGDVNIAPTTTQVNLGAPTRVVQGARDIQLTSIQGTSTIILDGPKEFFGEAIFHEEVLIKGLGTSNGVTVIGDSSNLLAYDLRHDTETTISRIEVDRANGREFRILPSDITGSGVITLLKHDAAGKTIMGNTHGETFRLVNNSFHVGYTADSDFTTLVNGTDTGLSIRDDGIIHSGTTNSSGNLFNYSGGNSNISIQRFFKGGSDVGSIDLTNTTTTYNTSSDGRLKDVTGPIGNGVQVIKDLEPVEFTWKSDEDQTPDFGFIAQQVNETGASYAVSDKNPDHLKMDYGRITPHLVAALKEALERIDRLEERLEESA